MSNLPRVHFQLLGAFSLYNEEGDDITPRARKARSLLAYLTLQNSHTASRQMLMSMLWSDRSLPQAQASLRVCLSEIRSAFGNVHGIIFSAQRQLIRLSSTHLACDALELKQNLNTQQTTDYIPTWSGELLIDLDGIDSQFDEWLYFERTALRATYCTTLESRMNVALSERRYTLGAQLGQAILRVDPSSESAYRALITQYANNGNVGAALRQYDTLRQMLRRALDAVPSQETEALVKRLRTGQYQPAVVDQANTESSSFAPEGRSNKAATLHSWVTGDGDRPSILISAGSPASGQELIQSAPNQQEYRYVTVLNVRAAVARALSLASLEDTPNGFIDFVSRIVHAASGRILATDDTITAIFGASQAADDHAVSACEAAYKIRRDAFQHLPSAVSLAFGVDSGVILVRSATAEPEIQSGMGVISAAKRLSMLSSKGEIFLSGKVRDLLSNAFPTSEVPTDDVALRADATVFKLLDTPVRHTRWEARSVTTLTEFVGRAVELRALGDIMLRSRQKGQVVAVVGETGVGKSRLLHEFSILHAKSATVLTTGANAGAEQSPFAAVRRLFEQLLWTSNRKPGSRHQSLGDQPDQMERDETGLETPTLDVLLSLHVSVPGWENMTPAQRRPRLVESLIQLLVEEGRQRQIVVIIDDLHKIDKESSSIFSTLIDSISSSAVTVLLTHPSNFSVEWERRSFYNRIYLEPLDQNDSYSLLDTLMGHDASIERLKNKIADISGGNPLYIEEIVKTLAAAEHVLGSRGGYRCDKDFGSRFEIPWTIAATISAGFNSLDSDDKVVLRHAAVIGEVFPVMLLDRIISGHGSKLEGVLNRLVSREILRDASSSSKRVLRFSHSLTCEVARSSMLAAARRAIHAKIVDVLPTLDDMAAMDRAAQLAYHSKEAELWELAVDANIAAGDLDSKRSAYHAALTHFGTAIGILNSEDIKESQRKRLHAHLAVSSSHLACGELREAQSALRIASDLAGGDTNEHDISCRILLQRAAVCAFTGSLDESLACGQAAIGLAALVGDETLGLAGQASLTAAHFFRGEFTSAVDFAVASWESLKGNLVTARFGSGATLAVECYGYGGMAFAQLGNFVDARRSVVEACRIAAMTERSFDRAVAEFYRQYVLSHQGVIAGSTSALKSALVLCDADDLRFLRTWLRGHLGFVYEMRGNIHKSIRLMEISFREAVRMQLVLFQAYDMTALARLYYKIGDLMSAEECAVRGVALAAENGFASVRVWALRNLSVIRRHSSDADKKYGYTLLDEAVEIAESLRMRPDVAHLYMCRARAFREDGKESGARECAMQALAMYREMGMSTWIPEAKSLARE